MTSDLSLLIVDDDPVSLQLLQAVVQDTGFRVRATTSPVAALQQIGEQPPDLLLTDLRMPEMSGLDLIHAARRLQPDLCCLMVTAFASDEATAEAFRAGTQDLFAKPINLEEARARLLHAAELVVLRREVRALRASPPSRVPDPTDQATPPRVRELTDLPALPGSAAPVDSGGRAEIFHRLDRLGSLFRQGIITSIEFEEKKRVLLGRI